MTINLLKVRKIILSDRWRRVYKPDRSALRKIATALPDCNIFGFGIDPLTGYWIVIAESSMFPDNPSEEIIQHVHIKDLALYSAKKVLFLPKK